MSHCDSPTEPQDVLYHHHNEADQMSSDDEEDYFIAEEDPKVPDEEEEEQCLTPDDVPPSHQATGLENYFTRLALEGEQDQNVNTTSFAALRESQGNTINLIYSNEVDSSKKSNLLKSNELCRNNKAKHTTFAALPNSTTWQQLSANNAASHGGTNTNNLNVEDGPLATQLLNVRLKLEEKRRKIEQEKRRMEALCKHQRQKLSKAAFLQAISKVNTGGGGSATPDSDSSKDDSSSHSSDVPMPDAKELQLQEITEHLNSVSDKWLKSPSGTEEPQEEEDDSTDTMNSDEFQTSIELLNTSLTDIQEDIARIAMQERMIKTMMTTQSAPPSTQPYYPTPPSYASPTPPSHHAWKPHNYNNYASNDHERSWNQHIAANHWTPQPSLNAQIPPNFYSTHYPDHSETQSYPVYSQNISTYNQPYTTPRPSLTIHRTNSASSVEGGSDAHIIPTSFPSLQVNKPDKLLSKGKLKPMLSTIPSLGTPEEIKDTPEPLENGDATENAKPVTQQKFYVSFDSKPPRKAKPKLTPKIIPPSAKNPPLAEPPQKIILDNEPPLDISSTKPSLPSKLPPISPPPVAAPAKPLVDPPPIIPEPPPVAEPCVGFVIGADLVTPDPKAQTEMERKKEQIMLMSLRRKAEAEQRRAAKEAELSKKREEERLKKEEAERRKEEKRIRHQLILEQYLERKAQKENAAAMDGAGDPPGMQYSPARTTPRPKSGSQKLTRPKSAQMDTPLTNNSTSTATLTLSEVDYESLPSRTDCISETSAASSNYQMEYTGPKLFVKPTGKSNRTIIINAISTVLAGAVNAETKRRVLVAVQNSDSKHFLILFRDAGCQFRGLYAFNPDSLEGTEVVTKLYGTGPRTITPSMMDKFYKYNSGGKCFSQVHTKHLTVTIDAFTIHNALWTGRCKGGNLRRPDLPLL